MIREQFHNSVPLILEKSFDSLRSRFLFCVSNNRVVEDNTTFGNHHQTIPHHPVVAL